MIYPDIESFTRDFSRPTPALPRNLQEGEYNRLHIENIKGFFQRYDNNFDYYKPPLAILAELEAEILHLNELPGTVLISYKEEGFAIFDFVRLDCPYYYDKGGRLHVDKRIVTYRYASTVS